jgi:DNA polymerase III alpha subunit
VMVAGMVVARQRPATANGVVFMLLEDERGTINLIVPPPVVERCRLAVRTSGFVQARGKLEHRDGTTNVVVSAVERVERPDLPPADTRQESNGLPSASPAGTLASTPERETGRELGHRIPLRSEGPDPRGPAAPAPSKRAFDGVREAAMAELAASLPAPHSFGRRGR